MCWTPEYQRWALAGAYADAWAAAGPCSIVAYYVADLKGTDVDQPRNLAKTVTVE